MPTATQTQTKTQIKVPSMWTVILHNDDYTPMDFVTQVLVHVFHLSVDEAAAIMMTVHVKGKAKVGLFTKEIAQTKALMVKRLAEDQGHPLLAEPKEA